MSFNPNDPALMGLPPEILAALMGGAPPPPLAPPPPMGPPPPGAPIDPMTGQPMPLDPAMLAALDELDMEGEDVPDPEAGEIEAGPEGLFEPPIVPTPRSVTIASRVRDYELKKANDGKRPRAPKIEWLIAEKKRR